MTNDPRRPGVAGKRVLITGATGGIGLAAAVELARRGARLAIVARSRERAAEAVAKIKIPRKAPARLRRAARARPRRRALGCRARRRSDAPGARLLEFGGIRRGRPSPIPYPTSPVT